MPEVTHSRVQQYQQQQQQEKPSIMKSLFSVFQQVAPLLGPEAMMASKIGGGLFGSGGGANTSALSGIIPMIAGAMGDNNGDGNPDSGALSSATNVSDFGRDSSQQKSPETGDPIPDEVDLNAVPEVDSTQEEEETPTEKEENPTDTFSSMSVRDFFNQYPGSEQLFLQNFHK